MDGGYYSGGQNSVEHWEYPVQPQYLDVAHDTSPYHNTTPPTPPRICPVDWRSIEHIFHFLVDTHRHCRQHGLRWTAIHHWKSRYATDNGSSAGDVEPITASGPVAGSENRTSIRSTSSNRNVVLPKTILDCLGAYPKLSRSCRCW